MIRCLSLLSLLLLPLTIAAVEVREFASEEQRQRYESLLNELRCLVCQNQSLADSDADLAKDLRNEVYDIIQSGKSEAEAIRFLTDRYGDFVLYRPPLKPITLLLWGGPVLLLGAGGAFVWRQGKRRRQLASIELTEDERRRLERLRKRIES